MEIISPSSFEDSTRSISMSSVTMKAGEIKVFLIFITISFVLEALIFILLALDQAEF